MIAGGTAPAREIAIVANARAREILVTESDRENVRVGRRERTLSAIVRMEARRWRATRNASAFDAHPATRARRPHPAAIVDADRREWMS